MFRSTIHEYWEQWTVACICDCVCEFRHMNYVAGADPSDRQWQMSAVFIFDRPTDDLNKKIASIKLHTLTDVLCFVRCWHWLVPTPRMLYASWCERCEHETMWVNIFISFGVVAITLSIYVHNLNTYFEWQQQFTRRTRASGIARARVKRIKLIKRFWQPRPNTRNVFI